MPLVQETAPSKNEKEGEAARVATPHRVAALFHALRLFELARVLVRLDHVARIIVNANHGRIS